MILLKTFSPPAFIRKYQGFQVGKNMHFQCLMCLFLLPSYELSEVPPIAAMHSDLSWEKCDLQAVQAAKRQQKKTIKPIHPWFFS